MRNPPDPRVSAAGVTLAGSAGFVQAIMSRHGRQRRGGMPTEQVLRHDTPSLILRPMFRFHRIEQAARLALTLRLEQGREAGQPPRPDDVRVSGPVVLPAVMTVVERLIERVERRPSIAPQRQPVARPSRQGHMVSPADLPGTGTAAPAESFRAAAKPVVMILRQTVVTPANATVPSPDPLADLPAAVKEIRAEFVEREVAARAQVDLEGLTDQVVRMLDRRQTAARERLRRT